MQATLEKRREFMQQGKYGEAADLGKLVSADPVYTKAVSELIRLAVLSKDYGRAFETAANYQDSGWSPEKVAERYNLNEEYQSWQRSLQEQNPEFS